MTSIVYNIFFNCHNHLEKKYQNENGQRCRRKSCQSRKGFSGKFKKSHNTQKYTSFIFFSHFYTHCKCTSSISVQKLIHDKSSVIYKDCIHISHALMSFDQTVLTPWCTSCILYTFILSLYSTPGHLLTFCNGNTVTSCVTSLTFLNFVPKLYVTEIERIAWKNVRNKKVRI